MTLPINRLDGPRLLQVGDEVGGTIAGNRGGLYRKLEQFLSTRQVSYKNDQPVPGAQHTPLTPGNALPAGPFSPHHTLRQGRRLPLAGTSAV